MTTKTAQFTPGPWNAYNVHKGRILKHWQVDTGTGKVMLDDAAQWEAGNAALIAAAPAMYEAIKSLLEHEGKREYSGIGTEHDSEELEHAKQAARAALAQAEGRQG